MEELIIGRQDAMPQRRKPRPASFTPAKRKRFLAALAATCNVALAARHAGVDKTTPYYHRIRDATFRAQWQAAIEEGYDRLEELVLLHGGAGQPMELEAGDAPDADALPPFDFDRAMAVLKHYRGRRDGSPLNRGGRPLTRVTIDETNAALLRALKAVERRIARRKAD